MFVIKCCRLYNILGLVQAMEYMSNSLLKPQHSVMGENGLLLGAGTRFATWFYAMHTVLHQKLALKATIQNPSFASLLRNNHVAPAIKDIDDKVFWKVIYCLLHALFPALKALMYCHSNIHAIDKIIFLVKKADGALLDSQKSLDNKNIFGSMRVVI